METQYFDPDALYNLLGNDKNVILKMLENILIGAGKKYDAFMIDLQNEDWKLITGDAHFLKSNFRYLGVPRMAALLKDVEIFSGDEEKRSLIPPLVEEFKLNFPVVMEEVRAYVKYLKEL